MSAASGSEPPVPDPLADDRALWDLLDRARRPPAPGPFFVRRVLRAVACFEEERAVPVWRRRWEALVAARPRTVWSGASFAGAAAAVVLTASTFGFWSGVPMPFRRHPQPFNLPAGAMQPGDAEVIAHLDELTESNENAVWLDEDDESAS